MSEETFWRTAISKLEKGKILIRGYAIEDLIERHSFGDVVYLIFKGELPDHNEGKMIEAILVSSVDHSLVAPSVNAARFVASSGVPLQACVAGGILAVGNYHAGAIEECARILQESMAQTKGRGISCIAEKIVKEYQQDKKRIPGFGHPIHNPDPRTLKLLEKAKTYSLLGEHTLLAQGIGAALKKIKGKDLPMNVDGAIAGIISDMGIPYRFGKGFFIISRAVGLIAHSVEEMQREKPFRAVSLDDITYDGPQERKTGKPKGEEE